MRRRLIDLSKLAVAAALGACLVGGVNAFGTGESTSTVREHVSEPVNLGEVKLDVEDYYGGYVDADGNNQASSGSPWDREVDRAVGGARDYLQQRLADGVSDPAIVLDIDDTAELTYGWEADNDFGFDEDRQRAAIDADVFDPIVQIRELANWAKERGVRVYFLTGREESLRDPSLRNLDNAGYPEPDGAFFEPEDEAPEYLPCGLDCDTVQYKSGTRAHIESLGNNIVLNVGDQFTDLQGGHSEKSVKLPNPMYYLD